MIVVWYIPGLAAVTAQPATGVRNICARRARALESSEALQSEDLLAQRLRETERWLDDTDSSRITIQLLGASNAEILRNDLRILGEYVELERVFVYRTVANRRPSFTVLLGTYGTRTEAIRAIEELPEPIRMNRPYYRTIRGVRAEIAGAKIASRTASAATVDGRLD